MTQSYGIGSHRLSLLTSLWGRRTSVRAGGLGVTLWGELHDMVTHRERIVRTVTHLSCAPKRPANQSTDLALPTPSLSIERHMAQLGRAS
jgi:hypothetical protein